ncbi:MAG: hypothetical protein OXH69_04935 [Acidobacteria bacterium]|nr:hypothetical protein [Acidobacteriota bacterium]
MALPRQRRVVPLLAAVALATTAACATSGAFRTAQQAELRQDFDRAVIEYGRAVAERPNDRQAQLALERAKLRAAEVHYAEGRRLARLSRWRDALAEFQIAYELNPSRGDVADELRDARAKVELDIAARAEGVTELEALIHRTRDAATPGLDLPRAVKLPDSVVFRDASARAVFSALGQLADVTIVFDPTFSDTALSIDLRSTTFDVALAAVAASTRNFFRVTQPGTVTIIPDTPAKRREYEEEVVRTFFLNHADVQETIDLLRLVIDARRLAPTTGPNAISIKDTPERIEAAGRLLRAIDKAPAEVVIQVQLLEVDRQALREYGLPLGSPAGPGIDSTVTLEQAEGGFTLDDVARLAVPDLLVTNLPSLNLRLLETHTSTRVLANPRLRTSGGVEASASFGERVPVPVTTFTPFAAGGVNQQPITSFNYENVGVNIRITPRIHHDDEVTLEIALEISNISGTGYANVPQFGTREIETTIRLLDGETSILAGLIRDEATEVNEGIPGLNSVPVIGRIFGRTRTETQETDIVLTLTPHILRGLELDEEDLLPFRVDIETAAGATGLLPQPALQQRLPPPPPGGEPAFGGDIQEPILPPLPPIR